MGIYRAYEIEFLSHIEWDDLAVTIPFSKMNCFWLYLRDFPEERLIINLYSTTAVVDVLRFLSSISPLKFRDYGTTEWTDFRLS